MPVVDLTDDEVIAIVNSLSETIDNIEDSQEKDGYIKLYNKMNNVNGG